MRISSAGTCINLIASETMYSVLVVKGRGCQGLTWGAFSWISPPPAVEPAPTGSKMSRETMTATPHDVSAVWIP